MRELGELPLPFSLGLTLMPSAGGIEASESIVESNWRFARACLRGQRKEMT
jgi:hypothetical protein